MQRFCTGTLLAVLACAVTPPMAGATDAPAGVTWDSSITAVYQYADDDRVDPEFTASADLLITAPWRSGEWLIYIEGSTSPDADAVSAIYPTANADAGSVLNRDGDGGIQVSELNYTVWLDDNRSLALGLINPSAWLDRSQIANDENVHFLNGSFVNNATIEFPDYTFGGILRWLGSETRPEITLVASSSDGKADIPDRSYQDLLNLTADERGLFLGIDGNWLHDNRSVRLGAWLRSDDHAVNGNPDATEMNYGLYSVLGWHSGKNAVNLRLGLANEAVSVATRFAALAYQRETRLGLFGFGIATTRIANTFRQGDLESIATAEVFYRIAVCGGKGHVTLPIQYAENPGFDSDGTTASSSAAVAGVRFHWQF